MEITITTQDPEDVDVVTETTGSERGHATARPPEEAPSETVVSPPARYQPQQQQLTIAVESELSTGEGTDVVGPPSEFGPPGSW
ncbi:hypothetical protein [Natrinema caseinilyticum]|uniref:hypothetical protein n=1 Tax=Natrinema caseinilyticum TaxID=2961570 RepID=UPI0020C58A35|nr:hypothetical protein [Natrinema caseinilyticum]